MNLSLTFIYLKIKKKIPLAKLLLREGVNPVCSYVRLFSGTDDYYSKDLLYIQINDSEQIDTDMINLKLPIIVSESKSSLFSSSPQIVLPDMSNFYYIFNYVLSIFQKHQVWSQQIQTAILENKNLKELLEITSNIIDNPMYLADLSFKMLAWHGSDMEEMSVIWRYQIKYGYLPYNVLLDLVETGELDLLNNAAEACYVESSCFVANFVSKTINYHGKMLGHFFIIEMYHKINQCDIEIAEYFGELLSNATYDNHNYLTISSFYHEHFMVDILEHTLTDTYLIDSQLKALGWTMEGDYQLLVILSQNDDYTLRRHSMAFLTEGYNAQSYTYKNDIIVVYNDSLKQKIHYINQIFKFIKLYDRYCILSESFTRFDTMSAYFDQCLYILQNYDKTNLKKFTLCEDYFISHISDLVNKNLPSYQPADTLQLYDIKNHTEYCLTLYTYLLNERNTVKTARCLFLHRNTLKYRLEKIIDIISADLENPMIRQRLLLALHQINSGNHLFETP